MDPKTHSVTLTHRILDQLGHILLGKPHALRLALACLLAKGHLLIEDVPGVGKTTLAHALASTLGLSFQRVQFTSDLLPADLLGVSIFDSTRHEFRFHPGPIFAQLVLADELNRTTPRTQSALLEAMEERQITIDNDTYPLPSPFFVIATQNPAQQIGTFALPESQLDRFLMRISIGLPDAKAERELLTGTSRRELLQTQTPCTDVAGLANLQASVAAVHMSERAVDYVQALLAASRAHPEVVQGLSPRCGLGLLAAAKAWALIEERDHVRPEDIQAVFPAVAGHRIAARNGTVESTVLVQQLLESVPIT